MYCSQIDLAAKMEGAKKMSGLMRVESQFDMGASSMHKGILYNNCKLDNKRSLR